MLKSRFFRFWFVAALCFAGTLFAQPKQDATVAGTYRIGVGDHLEVSVWQHPNLSKTVVVDSDGNISLPSVSVVKAEGLSVQNLADLITRKLEFTFPKPHVTVLVSGTNSLPKRSTPMLPAPELQ